jgi:cystathionine beta-synthase
MKNNSKIVDNVLDLIGDTPMVRLQKVTQNLVGNYYGKLESFNPGDSVKDRIAKYIIDKAEAEGILKPGDTIIETTSGNTGFSLAMLGAVRGYRVMLAVKDKATEDKINMLRTMGAEVYVCPSEVAAEDPRSYYSVAQRLHEENPGSLYVNQYFNELNIKAHYFSSGKEIWEQTEGKVTHVIACSATGGTISGIARYLKEKNPNIKILGVDAYGSALKKYHETGIFDTNEIYSYRIEGLGKNLIPTATDFDLVDHFMKVTDENAAYKARELALREGIFAGYTSGAAVEAAHLYEKAGFFDKDSHVVIVFPDHGSRYLGKVFSDKWRIAQGFIKFIELEIKREVEFVT